MLYVYIPDVLTSRWGYFFCAKLLLRDLANSAAIAYTQVHNILIGKF